MALWLRRTSHGRPTRWAWALLLSLLVAAIAAPVQADGRANATRRHRSASRRRVNLRTYRASVRSWHDPGRVAPPTYTPDGRLVLRLYSVNTHARAEIVPARPDGGFDEAAAAEFARVLSDPRTHQVHAIDPRLMDLVYQVAVHFRAPQVTVISGFRAGAGHSNHAHGRAVDFLIPGVSDRRLAEHARQLELVGVGMYPTSGFVHLDVRDRSTYWVDRSGPGSSPRRHRRHHRHHRHHRHGRAHASR